MATASAIAKSAGSFLKLPLFMQLWSLPVWLMLGVSKCVVLAVPFRKLAAALGSKAGLAPWVPLLSDAQTVRARQIGHLVQAVARFTPWDSNCFPQAVTARLLLGLYGIPYALYFGLMRDAETSAMKAHAWVVAGPIRVTGGASFDQYAIVGMYVCPSLRRQAS
jgi:hypothetical protein